MKKNRNRTTMTFFILPLLLLLARPDGVRPDVGQTGPMCYDWGESRDGSVLVLDGEAAWLSCPLFSHPSVYNYTSSQSAGHNLMWYRTLDGREDEGEEPIAYSSTIVKERERIWLQPVAANDSGLYICMLRNKSSCSRITMRLNVLKPEQVVRTAACQPPVAVPTTHVYVPMQEGTMLDCPNLEDAAKMSDVKPTVNWTYVRPDVTNCYSPPFWNSDREQQGAGLRFYVMLDSYQGLYVCTVRYRRKNRELRFSRSVNVSAIYPTNVPKQASILHPSKDQVFTVKAGSEVRLVCRALFPFVPHQPASDIWWTVDGKEPEKFPRFSQSSRVVKDDYKDLTKESVLTIRDFQSKDLNREFNCSVKNAVSFESRRAALEEEASLPSVELGFGLGATLLLMLLLFVLYHVFWLELLLLYRSWFGTDERHTDEKDYDVYISYARNSEDEQFVLSTLRSVLENELGYSVCIFDRDSLPGGTITDETLSFVARSRRLLVVVSPGYASQGSQALLELKAGIDGMALGGHLQVILVQYKPVQRQGLVRELRRARVALAVVRWKGDKSRELTSRFWKQLRLELPMRRENGKEVSLVRLTSQNSTNSQTGLITNEVKDRVFHSAI